MLLLTLVVAIALAIQLGTFVLSGAIMVWRMRHPRVETRETSNVHDRLTIIVPIAALASEEADIAIGAARWLPADTSLIYCAEDLDEPAARRVTEGLSGLGLDKDARIRMLASGPPQSANPKLDTIECGYNAVDTDRVVFIDGNLRLAPDYVDRIRAVWGAGVTLVSTSPVASDAGSFWAEVEAADISLSHARWMLAGDVLGFRFGHGKLLGFSRSWLSERGGFDQLRKAVAEDAELTRMSRSDGSRISLVGASFAMPLGARSLVEVLERNLRWRRIRVATIPGVYVTETFNKLWSIFLVAAVLFSLIGWPIWAGLLPIALLWHMVEGGALAASGLGWSWRTQVAIALRDLAEPFLWLAGLFGRSYRWRGREFRP